MCVWRVPAGVCVVVCAEQVCLSCYCVFVTRVTMDGTVKCFYFQVYM